MMAIRIMIVEDEQLIAKDIEQAVKAADSSVEVVHVSNSLQDARSFLKTNPTPDLLLLDIQLGDGISFDLFNGTQIECPVIFITAYDEYAIRAFKMNSVDYLLKPINKNDLSKALEKFRKFFYQKPQTGQQVELRNLLKHLQDPGLIPKYKERFMVHNQKGLMPVPVSDIACFLKEEMIYIYTMDGQQFASTFDKMEDIEDLVNPELFFRANRQCIVQAGAVQMVKPDVYSKLIAYLKKPLNKQVDISREKAQAFKAWLG